MQNIRGRSFQHRDLQAVVIDRDVTVPSCNNCGELLLDDEDTDAFMNALDESYTATRWAQVDMQLRQLLQMSWTQRDIEAVLGVSDGYISKVRRGRRDLGIPLYRMLVMLARHPKENLDALTQDATLPKPVENRLKGLVPALR